MVLARQLMDIRIPRVRVDDPWARWGRLLGFRPHLVVVDHRGHLVGLLTRGAISHTQRVMGEAQDHVQPACTVTPEAPATAALKALGEADGGAVVVAAQRRPEGVVSVQDIVQMARFVLPPQWTVADVLEAYEAAPLARVPDLGQAHLPLIGRDEARRGADALVAAGGPLPVLATCGHRLGTLTEGHLVQAVRRLLESPKRPSVPRSVREG